MKNNLKRTIFLLTMGLILTNCSTKEITCVIRGKVINRASDTLILQKATDDVRFAQIKIPIIDSVFEYKLVIPETEAYYLIFQDEITQGAWKPILLFPVTGEINCLLRPTNEFKNNQITGSKFNSEYDKFQKTLEDIFMPKYQLLNDSSSALRKRNNYYSDDMLKLQQEIQKAKDRETELRISAKINDLRSSNKHLSKEAIEINNQMDKLRLDMAKWKYDYIANNPTILSYYFLINDLQGIKYNKVNPDDIRKNKESFIKAFPDHPYNELIQTLLDSQDSIKIGGTYINFSAPDLTGKIFKLSDIIKGKIALIDLWASWCGPCIMTSRSMIPVYEEFKDRGFIVCGVAAEIKNTDQMIKIIEKEKYPWINLVDLDNNLKIWNKYGIPNAGGGTFLVDKDGKILGINPTAEEVRNTLTERLK